MLLELLCLLFVFYVVVLVIENVLCGSCIVVGDFVFDLFVVVVLLFGFI